MNATILVATVGGETAPQITAIDTLRPTHAIFICSTQSAAGVDALIARVRDAGGTAEKLLLDHVDDLEQCYGSSYECLVTLRNTHPDAEVRADYTGGTKTMSAALVAAATEVPGVQLSLVTGTRVGSARVVDGTQSLRTLQTSALTLKRLKDNASAAFERYDYGTTMALLREAFLNSGLHANSTEEMQDWLSVTRALDCWDRFQHVQAWNLLLGFRERMNDQFRFLKAVIWSRTCADASFTCDGLEGIGNTAKGHGYELVDDLLLNAERRAARGLYDDAVARLYRATELLAQIRLQREYHIDTGNIDTANSSLMPADVDWLTHGMSPNKKRIDLGLMRSYELLARFSARIPEPLGSLFNDRYRDRIRDFLLLRNASLLAHGCTPLTQSEWEKAHAFFSGFLQDAHRAMGLKPYAQPAQFPTDPSAFARR